MTTRIGFLGLGAMGAGMARRLLAAGYPVSVYNRTTVKAEALRTHGATVAASPTEALAGADVVLLSLATADVVEELLFTSGALTAANPGAVVADMSTVSPAAAQASAARIEAAGRRALDACVLGNARHAEEGELRFMIGGGASDVDSVRPVLEVLSKEIVHLGPSGKGATAKIALNLIMGVQMQVLAEAVVLGEAAGLDRGQLIDMIAASGYSSPVMRFKSGVMSRRDFTRPDFRLSLMRKDLQLAVDQAAELDVPLPATAASLEVLTAAESAGHGDLDCAAVLLQVERS
ncbi:NAD(P)-dependent oxidoreductase [Actinokineospora enzanensis]|uniref:NAD(P)-dependent oxidoreductase n=1 Tax=Actinokineospora enzanensis TaxID=155975 RepID=UPI00037B2485|nr:NAD(P)-dependent oxidoreductase [Actinokineospora enzanensis]